MELLTERTKDLDPELFLSQIDRLSSVLVDGLSVEITRQSEALFGATSTNELFGEFVNDGKRFKVLVQPSINADRHIDIVVRPARRSDFEKPRVFSISIGPGQCFYTANVYCSAVEIKNKDNLASIIQDLVTTHDVAVGERMVAILGGKYGHFAEAMYRKLRELGGKPTTEEAFLFSIAADDLDVPIYDRDMIRVYLEVSKENSQEFGRSMNEVVMECLSAVPIETTPLGNELYTADIVRKKSWEFEISKFQPTFGESIEVVQHESITAINIVREGDHQCCLYFPSGLEALVSSRISPKTDEFVAIYNAHRKEIDKLRAMIKRGKERMDTTDIGRFLGAFAVGATEALSKTFR